ARARALEAFNEPRETYEGWTKFNRNYWLESYADFVQFFFSRIFVEPHSTKPIEDAVGWALETTPEMLVATQEATNLDPETTRELAGRIRCPVLVIHGGEDEIRSSESAAELAALTHGTLVMLEGSGHAPHVRDPV